mgnify:CR=1 FL=1
MKKIIIALLSAALLLAALSGCVSAPADSEPTKPESSAESTAETPTDPTEAPTDPTTPTEPSAPSGEPESEPASEPASEPTTPDTEGAAAERVVKLAAAQLGKSFAEAAAGPDTFDNSGLLYYCYGQVGIKLARGSRQQSTQGEAVEKKDLRPGDAVFFSNDLSGQVQFAGIYTGNGKFIAACNETKPVSEMSLNWTYFAKRFICARRYITE